MAEWVSALTPVHRLIKVQSPVWLKNFFASLPDYYLLDSMNVAWMFTSTAIGMCLGPAPFYFAHAVDTRVLIFSYGVLSALSSILYPWLDSLGFWPAMASQLHFTNDLVLRWTPQSEASFFFSIMLATSQFGPLITMILGGEMCSSSFFGWEGAYYILGVGTFIASSAFAYFYSDSVEENRHLTESEKKYILTGKHSTKEKQPVPYKSLLKDCTIWISLLMFTGYYLAMIVYQQYSPIFIKQRAAQHSHFALNLNMVIAGVAQILIPLGVQATVPDNTRNQVCRAQQLFHW
uniref:Major facilitator superfamily (MFS) profile domain-containing protein n=2 Tax=Caenorhabditis japonica TaxID=281687 RepID=A0A8R1EXI9_CAEJA